MKRSRVAVTVTPAELAELRRRARLHGMSMSAFLRTAALGPEPSAAAADAWWDALPHERRAQVHRWLTNGQSQDGPPPGQLCWPEET